MATSFTVTVPPTYNVPQVRGKQPDLTCRSSTGARQPTRIGNPARWADLHPAGWTVTDKIAGVIATDITRNDALRLIAADRI